LSTISARGVDRERTNHRVRHHPLTPLPVSWKKSRDSAQGRKLSG
jgi:hypothetical protein